MAWGRAEGADVPRCGGRRGRGRKAALFRVTVARVLAAANGGDRIGGSSDATRDRKRRSRGEQESTERDQSEGLS